MVRAVGPVFFQTMFPGLTGPPRLPIPCQENPEQTAPVTSAAPDSKAEGASAAKSPVHNQWNNGVAVSSSTEQQWLPASPRHQDQYHQSSDAHNYGYDATPGGQTGEGGLQSGGGGFSLPQAQAPAQQPLFPKTAAAAAAAASSLAATPSPLPPRPVSASPPPAEREGATLRSALSRKQESLRRLEQAREAAALARAAAAAETEKRRAARIAAKLAAKEAAAAGAKPTGSAESVDRDEGKGGGVCWWLEKSMGIGGVEGAAASEFHVVSAFGTQDTAPPCSPPPPPPPLGLVPACDGQDGDGLTMSTNGDIAANAPLISAVERQEPEHDCFGAGVLAAVEGPAVVVVDDECIVSGHVFFVDRRAAEDAREVGACPAFSNGLGKQPTATAAAAAADVTTAKSIEGTAAPGLLTGLLPHETQKLDDDGWEEDQGALNGQHGGVTGEDALSSPKVITPGERLPPPPILPTSPPSRGDPAAVAVLPEGAEGANAVAGGFVGEEKGPIIMENDTVEVAWEQVALFGVEADEEVRRLYSGERCQLVFFFANFGRQCVPYPGSRTNN